MRKLTQYALVVFLLLICVGCNGVSKPAATSSCNSTTWNGTFSGVSQPQGGMQPLTLIINGDSFTGTLGGLPISGAVSYCAGETLDGNPCSPVGVNSIVPTPNLGITNWFEITINGVIYQSEDYVTLNAAAVGNDSNLCMGEMSSFNLLPVGQPYSVNGWGLTNSVI
jgi:hypothetical protein